MRDHLSSRKARLATLFVLVCAIALFAVPAVAMAVDITGNVQGRLPGAAAAPLQNAEVDLYDADGNYYDYAYTNMYGNYTFTDVEPGVYHVEFGKSGYVTQYYNNKSTLLLSDTVPAGATGINATLLSDQAMVSGKVLGRNPGVADAAVQNVEVTAYDAVTGLELGYDYTDALGNYSFTCDATKVKIGFSQGNYVPQYYSNKPNMDTATVLDLTPAQAATNINATILSRFAKVTGTVRGKRAGETTAPVQNIEVTVYDATTGVQLGYDYTDVAGYYEVKNVPYGNVKIGFSQTSNYIDQYWNNKPNLTQATIVSLAPAQLLANVSPTLISKYAKVKGNVKGLLAPGATPTNLQNIEVNILDATTGLEKGYDYTDALGNYEIQVPTGSYKVKFVGNSSWGEQFYNNKPDFASGQTLNLVPAQLATINTTMYTPGVIYNLSGSFKNPIAYELASFLKTQFKFKADQDNVQAVLVLKTASGDKVLYNQVVPNQKNVEFALPEWNGLWQNQRLTSASYTWEFTATKNGHSTKTTGKLLISKVMFTLSGTSINNVALTKQAYMVPGNANVYVGGSTTAASDTFKIGLTGPLAYNVAVGNWTLNSSAPINTVAYVNGTKAIKSRALHTWSMTGLKSVKYNITVIQ